MNVALERIQEERASCWNRMTEIMDGATKDGRDLTGEERANWDKANERLTDLTKDKERAQRQAELEVESRAASEQRAAVAPVPSPQEVRGAAGGEVTEERVASAFGNFLRRGISDLPAEDRAIMQSRFEQRAEGVATGSAGGYLVPQGFWENLVIAMKAYGGLLNYADVIDTATGNPLPWPSVDDTSNVGAILGENTQVSDQDIAFTTKMLNAYTYTSNQVRVSLQLLQDSAFDVDSFVTGRLAERIGRAVAQHLVTGSGTNQPQGVVTGLTNSTQLPTGNTTSLTYDSLVALTHSIDPAYRNSGNARFLMHDTALASVRKIKDTQGRPLWTPDYLGQSDRDVILGYPVAVDQSLATQAANSTSVLFGDFHRGYVVRRALGLQLLRLTERYADYLQVGFIGFMRLDGKVNDARAIAAIQQSAT